ncbi:MAG: DUF4365 domain-containing protein, partial [Acidimicrobiales bacterium]
MKAKFERIGWGPVSNKAHDLGTDLLVLARDERRFERCLIVGVQVKAGPSYFARRDTGPNDDTVGWWYKESDANHFDDWVTHGLPHLLVLHDLDSNTSYWVHVTAEAVVSTGKGCKILVPAHQVIDQDHFDDLMEVAATQKAAPALEGTAFSAAAELIPPARRLRYALVAPRLVAPHRNVGSHKPLNATEAIALLAQGRFRDLKQSAERHASVPDPEATSSSTDWGWRFVAAFWDWATTDSVDQLRIAFDCAPDKTTKAASGVLLSCALLRLERHGDALTLLDGLVEGDALGPVDHGWVLVQSARARSEVGDVAGARSDAIEAQRNFVGDADDVTVSALAAAATWLLFSTADPMSGDFGEMMMAGDTAVSWWRSQTISTGLNEATTTHFRTWAEDTSHRWVFEDIESMNLFAAELSADLTGEHGTWRAVSALGAKQRLMNAAAAGDETGELVEGLDSLRRSGDDKSLQLALLHLVQTGPIEAVALAVNKIPPVDRWTHTTAAT